MKLAGEFYRLPLRFDARRLSQEAGQFSEAEWRPHPQGHPGNSALPLLASGGDPANKDTRGPMRPTAYLCSLFFVLGQFVGRSIERPYTVLWFYGSFVLAKESSL